MKTSLTGQQMLHAREGLRLRPYEDSQGHCTVGRGHLIHRGRCTAEDFEKWTLPNQAAADALFAQDLVPYENAVNEAVKVPLADHQFDALVSLCFNIGTGGFKGSTVVKRLNAGDFDGVPAAMMMWTKNKELTGRRRGEVAQFRTPYGNQTPPPLAAVAGKTLVRGPSAKFTKAEWLHPVFRLRLEAMYDEVPFINKSGGRSRQRQHQLWLDFQAGRGNPANRAGTSWHEYDEDGSTLAQAADIHPKQGYTFAQLHAAGKRHGVHFPVESEDWHAQPVEAKSSKRAAGQGLGPVPAYWNPQPQEEEDDMIRYGLIILPGPGRPTFGVFLTPVPIDGVVIENGKEKVVTVKPGQAAKVGISDGNLLNALIASDQARGPTQVIEEAAFNRIPTIGNI